MCYTFCETKQKAILNTARFLMMDTHTEKIDFFKYVDIHDTFILLSMTFTGDIGFKYVGSVAENLDIVLKKTDILLDLSSSNALSLRNALGWDERVRIASFIEALSLKTLCFALGCAALAAFSEAMAVEKNTGNERASYSILTLKSFGSFYYIQCFVYTQQSFLIYNTNAYKVVIPDAICNGLSIKNLKNIRNLGLRLVESFEDSSPTITHFTRMKAVLKFFGTHSWECRPVPCKSVL